MNTKTRRTLSLCILVLGSCRKPAPPKPPEEPAQAPTNRIAVPETVRRNLGIEFVKVERRRVAQTLRLPGHFELLPVARHEHRVPLAGRVEVLVLPLQQVKQGDLLYRIESPEWRRMQREIGELTTSLRVTEARVATMPPLVAAHRAHEGSLREAKVVMEGRIRSLEETRASVGGQASELAAARVQLAQVGADLAEASEKHAEIDALIAELQANLLAGRDRLKLALDAAATVVGIPVETLRQAGDGPADELPAWRKIAAIDVRSHAAGIVDKLPVATGVWVETGALVLTITDLGKVRFRARGLQSDLPRLLGELPARVVAPQSNARTLAPVPGTLALGVEADPLQRTLDLFVQPATTADWARPGVAGFLEVETRGGAEAELAVPRSAVLEDGLQRVLFRRDLADPDKVIRTEADLGIDDGQWVEVKSGLCDGDEVVLAGAYELMLATSGAAAKGGHFHADGTFHGDDHK